MFKYFFPFFPPWSIIFTTYILSLVFIVCSFFAPLLVMSMLSDIVGLDKFIGQNPIISFADFLSSKDDGLFIVVACYFSVDEGVDKWFDLHSSTPQPRLITKFVFIISFLFFYLLN